MNLLEARAISSRLVPFEIANFGEIKEIRTTDLKVGRNTVDVVMSTWDNKDIVEPVVVDVPASLASSIVSLEITAGDSAKLDAAPPVDLKSLLAAFRSLARPSGHDGALARLDGAALLGERAAILRLARRGTTSVGGHCRLVAYD